MTAFGVLAVVALAFAAFPALMYLRNVRAFRRPSLVPLSPRGEGDRS